MYALHLNTKTTFTGLRYMVKEAAQKVNNKSNTYWAAPLICFYYFVFSEVNLIYFLFLKIKSKNPKYLYCLCSYFNILDTYLIRKQSKINFAKKSHGQGDGILILYNESYII